MFSTRGVRRCRVEARLLDLGFGPGIHRTLARDGDRRQGPGHIEGRGGVLDEGDTEAFGDTIVRLDELDAQPDVLSVLEGSPEHARGVGDGGI